VRLFAKEFETERNNQIVFAFDCGQTMCEPLAGMPRIDRAVSAALLTSYVALKSGDRVALYGFAARPEVMTPFISDTRDFYRLQSEAARRLSCAGSISPWRWQLASCPASFADRRSAISPTRPAPSRRSSIGRLVANMSCCSSPWPTRSWNISTPNPRHAGAGHGDGDCCRASAR
jgi:uncharacterized protein (DUF58 family)